MRLAAAALAKINLTLRVLGARDDGYHELQSLVAFADYGDVLELTPGPELSLAANGPFARNLPPGDNLVLKAARAAAEYCPELTLGHFRLKKRLPVASGMGGGSADAAAALHLIKRTNSGAIEDSGLNAIADRLGSDIRACLRSRAVWMQGRGERVSPAAPLPPVFAVLAHPGVPISTREVFRLLGAPPASAFQDEPAPGPFRDCAELAAYMRGHPNDLESAAAEIAPVIADVLAALERRRGALSPRMSGSGAACFALFEHPGEAELAQAEMAREHPDWWLLAAQLR